jgi:hypothetical protein
MLTGFAVITVDSRVAPLSRPAATTRNSASRSVKMPASLPPSTTIIAPTLRWRIWRAASATVIAGGAVSSS